MIHGGVLQCLERGGAHYPIPFHDRLWMGLHPDELLRLSQQLRRKHRDARRPVSDLTPAPRRCSRGSWPQRCRAGWP